MRRTLMLALLAIVGAPALAHAAEGAASGGWVGPFAVIAAGVGMAIAAGLCGLGQGRAVASAVGSLTAPGRIVCGPGGNSGGGACLGWRAASRLR